MPADSRVAPLLAAVSALGDCPPEAITHAFSAFALDTEALLQCAQFDEQRYQRILLALNDRYSIILNCWAPGQMTPVHEHSDRTVWIRVLKGALRCTRYRSDEQPLEVMKQHRWAEGEQAQRVAGNIGYHCVENPSDMVPAVSLHLFSPPYLSCVAADCVVPPIDMLPFCPSSPSDLSSEGQLPRWSDQGPIDLNFQQLSEILRREIQFKPDTTVHSDSTIARVKKILTNTRFHPAEWEQYQRFAKEKYIRSLVSYSEQFTILILCWERGQSSPIHDHANSSCWVKVLSGQLQESLFKVNSNNTCSLTKQTILNPNDVAFIKDSMGVHAMGNPSREQRCVTMHVYSPPIKTCLVWDQATNPNTRRAALRLANNFTPQVHDTPHGNIKSLPELVAALREHFDSLGDASNREVPALLDSIDFARGEWDRYCNFGEMQYARNLLAYNDQFSLVLNCWGKGQGTPIHTHGEDANRKTWVKVLDGGLTFTEYFSEDGAPPAPIRVQNLEAGTPTILLDDATLGLHKAANTSSTDTAVSLHLYTPPYLECSSSAKCHLLDEHTVVPVVYCTSECAQTTGGPDITDHQLKLRLRANDKVFTNVRSFVSLLRQEFHVGTPAHADVSEMLRRCNFNPCELKEYVVPNDKYTSRSVVALDEHFSLTLTCWKPGQQSLVHSFTGSSTCSWLKVLEGEIHITEYEPGTLAESKQYVPENTVHMGGGVIRRFVNRSLSPAYLVHLDSPPARDCVCHCVETRSSASCPLADALAGRFRL